MSNFIKWQPNDWLVVAPKPGDEAEVYVHGENIFVTVQTVYEDGSILAKDERNLSIPFDDAAAFNDAVGAA